MESKETAVSPEPRHEEDYSARQVEAARRVLVDVSQVLASFADCLVVVGGWTPDLIMTDAEEPHVGSIDVDLVLDAAKLNDERYADLLKLLVDTGRYSKGDKDFQFVTEVDLKDDERSVQVEVEFLAPVDVKMKKHRPKLMQDFRVLQVDGAEVAFRSPLEVEISGKNVRGAENTVHLRVISLPDFLVMKSLAIGNRDKPKDAYDLCYCLQHCPAGMEEIAAEWKERERDKEVSKAIHILKEKFSTVNTFGPQQLVEFHNSPDKETQERHARYAFELVQKFLGLLQ